MTNTNTIVSEICAERGITCDSYSHGYILRLTKGDQVRRLYGNYWDLNSATADRLACDKCGCYTLLNASGIPAIPHTLVYNAITRGDWAGEEGTLQTALTYFEKHHRRIVVKPNHGTQGRDVYLCETPLALEKALMTIFAHAPDAALSPYVEIGMEYRVFYLAGRAYFMYGKARGDSWKHNLADGATAFELTAESADALLQAELATLATRAAQCIGINFASIDIAHLTDGSLTIVEINSGVMAVRLLAQLPHLRPTIKNMYAEALDLLFAPD
ncbi:MAG: ATP-grasp domain-containing protein [Defluviitaleaceae bacterium]|nr:ATP-grasp domain-containing protein [Defluviitaleaceae bacterium]